MLVAAVESFAAALVPMLLFLTILVQRWEDFTAVPYAHVSPQRIRWQGVVPLPAATLAVLKKLQRAG